jgi:hypothetical protein
MGKDGMMMTNQYKLFMEQSEANIRKLLKTFAKLDAAKKFGIM